MLQVLHQAPSGKETYEQSSGKIKKAKPTMAAKVTKLTDYDTKQTKSNLTGTEGTQPAFIFPGLEQKLYELLTDTNGAEQHQN